MMSGGQAFGRYRVDSGKAGLGLNDVVTNGMPGSQLAHSSPSWFRSTSIASRIFSSRASEFSSK